MTVLHAVLREGFPKAMRWQATAPPSRFDGLIAAVPVTLLNREEDAAPQGSQLLVRHAASFPRRAFPSKTAIRAPAVSMRLPDHQRRLSIASRSETIRLSTTVVTAPDEPQPITRVLTPRAEDPQHDAPTTNNAHTKFLVCAGRALNAESPRNNNEKEEEDSPTTSTPAIASQAHATPRAQRGLQRSDSELELIISELREKIALQNRSSQSVQPEDDACGNQHSRKHLKNPVEKMSLASSTTSAQVRRQAPASHDTATRLVREGSAAMVTPVVLSSSVSRSSGLFNHGGGACTNSLPSKEDAIKGGSANSEPQASGEGFRIRAYAAHPEPHTLHHSAFTSSTSLGQRLALAAPIAPSKETPTHASVERPSTKPRVRTLVDLDVELDCVAFCNGDRGDLSPVGPWDINSDPTSSLASSRSTCSFSSSSSISELILPPPAATELSPRSRLLWLSDCSSVTVNASTSIRVMAMLRPGSQQLEQHPLSQSRPASAMELRRRPSTVTSEMALAKARATSAKPSHGSAPRRPSAETNGLDESMGLKPQVVKRWVQRPHSGNRSSSSNRNSRSTITTTTSSVTPGRALIHHRPTFRA